MHISNQQEKETQTMKRQAIADRHLDHKTPHLDHQTLRLDHETPHLLEHHAHIADFRSKFDTGYRGGEVDGIADHTDTHGWWDETLIKCRMKPRQKRK